MSTRHQYGKDALAPQGFEAKAATRRKTLEMFRDSDYFVEGHLNGDWIDLCGEQDETLQMLLDEDVLKPGLGRYIGINDNPDVIAANKAHFAEATNDGRAHWIESRWADAIGDLAEFPRARVLNFDSCNSLKNKQLDAILHDPLTLTKHLYETNGGVLLVMNFTIGRTYWPKAKVEAMAKAYLERCYAWRDALNPGNRTKPQHVRYKSKTLPMLNVWLPLGF
jgi:hypothetical protein